mgnify:CR=1 FL=1
MEKKKFKLGLVPKLIIVSCLDSSFQLDSAALL